MPTFTTYDPITGKILSKISGKRSDVELNTSHYVKGDWDKNLYIIIDGSPIEKTQEEIASEELVKGEKDLRLIRNNLLSESDWTQVPDAPLTETQKAEWRIYRQKLRDLPANTEDPRNVIWPTKPSG